jgi:hypothetical protein
MKKIMESFINEARNKKTKNTKKMEDNDNENMCDKLSNLKINCLKCQNNNNLTTTDTTEYISNSYMDNYEISDLLSLPNYHNSFNNTEYINNNSINVNDINDMNEINVQIPEIKTLYSNEMISFKYNYLLNKFI